jgi:hypothetical protein
MIFTGRSARASGSNATLAKNSEAEIWAQVHSLADIRFDMAARRHRASAICGGSGAVTAIDDQRAHPEVTGFVMNASGGQAPPGAAVNLHAFDQMQVVYTATTTLEEDGSYTFIDLDMPPGRAFLTTLDYGGVVYGSDLAVAEDGKTSLELP